MAETKPQDVERWKRGELVEPQKQIIYYIDPATYYLKKSLMKSEMMGQRVEVMTTYSDYKKTDFGIESANIADRVRVIVNAQFKKAG